MKKEWSEFINKRVKLIYEDGLDHYSNKRGIVLAVYPTHLILQIGEENVAINLIKILRIEPCQED